MKRGMVSGRAGGVYTDACEFAKVVVPYLRNLIAKEHSRIEVSLTDVSGRGFICYEFSAVFFMLNAPLCTYTSGQNPEEPLNPLEEQDALRYHVGGLERAFQAVSPELPFSYPAQGTINHILFVPQAAPVSS